MANELNNQTIENTDTKSNEQEQTPSTSNALEMPDLNPTTADGIAALYKWINDRAEKSKIQNNFNHTKVILIDKDKPESMWAMRLRFPGTMTASQIIAASISDNGMFDMRSLMVSAIANNIIDAPKIDVNNLDEFANTHISLADAAHQIVNFLENGSNGQF